MGYPGSQYYNPSSTPDELDRLLRRNYLLLMLGQAALGLIGSEVVGMAIEPRLGEVVIHVVVTRETPALAEDLEDIAFELAVFLADGPERDTLISTRVQLGGVDGMWHDHQRFAPFYIARSVED